MLISSKFSSLVTSAIGAPPCLENDVIDIATTPESVQALVDTKVSESFLDCSLTKKLNLKLPDGRRLFLSLRISAKRSVKVVCGEYFDS